jgi:hypothetical protein
MDDIELLKLAAKAAGLSGEWKNTIGGWPCLAIDGNTQKLWVPLNDSGDAFRLACSKLMDISFIENGAYVEIICGLDDYMHAILRYQVIEKVETKSENDLYAATRRAIVRVAAMIGKEMP